MEVTIRAKGVKTRDSYQGRIFIYDGGHTVRSESYPVVRLTRADALLDAEWLKRDTCALHGIICVNEVPLTTQEERL